MIQNMKKFFSRAFEGKRLIMSIISILLLVGVSSFVIFELTKTSVTLVINGEETSLKTHAKTVDELMLENDILVGEHDLVEPSLTSKLADGMNVVWVPAKLVYFTNEGEKIPVWTTVDTVKQLTEELAVTVSEHDKITPSLGTVLVEEMQISYEAAFQVTLYSDGDTRQVWTTSTTVADFLEKEEITLGELDRVAPAQEDLVSSAIEINVIRVEKVTDVVEEEVSFATVTRNDSSLTRGTEREVQSGQKGKIAKYYEVIIENGKEISRELIKTETVQQSKDRVVAVGTKQIVQPVSRGGTPGEWLTFASTAYTAYCDGCSGRTSTGINLRSNPNQNIIAVDPSVIPLGSIIEIKYNGRVLGQYRAADTGRSIVGRKIDIFMAERNDALRWGRRNVQIRVIK